MPPQGGLQDTTTSSSTAKSSQEWVTVYPHNHTVYEFDDITFLVDGGFSKVAPAHMKPKSTNKLFVYLSAASPDTMNQAVALRTNKTLVPIIKNVAECEGKQIKHMNYLWAKLCESNSFDSALRDRFFERDYPYPIYSSCGQYLQLYVLQGSAKDAVAQRDAILTGNDKKMRAAAQESGLVSLLVYTPKGRNALVTRVLLTGRATRERVEKGLQRVLKYKLLRYSTFHSSDFNFNDIEDTRDKSGYPLQPEDVEKLSESERNIYFKKFYEMIEKNPSEVRPLGYFEVIHLPCGMEPEEAAVFVSNYRARIYFLPSEHFVNNLLCNEEMVETLSHAFRRLPDGQRPLVVPTHCGRLVTMLKDRGYATREFIVAPPTHTVMESFGYREEAPVGHRYEINTDRS